MAERRQAAPQRSLIKPLVKECRESMEQDQNKEVGSPDEFEAVVCIFEGRGESELQLRAEEAEAGKKANQCRPTAGVTT